MTDGTTRRGPDDARRDAADAGYRAAFEAIDLAFHRCEVVVDAEGRGVDYRLLDVNAAWARTTGFDPATAVGRTCRELVPSAEEEWIAACCRVGLERVPLRVEQEIAALGMWYDVHLVPFGPPGSRQFLATAADITARKRADAERARLAGEAAAARAAAERLLDQMADAYFRLDADWRIAAVNEAMVRGTGLGRAEMLGRDFWATFPGSAGTAFETHYRAAAAGTAARFTHDYSDGRLDLVVDVDAYPAPGPDGRPGVAVFWRDVTARARAEAATRAGDARYRALLDSIDVGFCVIEVLYDAAGVPDDYRFLETNPAFVRQAGFGDPAAGGSPGRRMREIAPDMDPFWFALYGRVVATGEPARVTQEAPALGRTYEVFAYRVDDPALRRVAVLFTDVSAREAARAERERLLAETEAARAAADLERRRLRATLDQLPVGVHVAEAPSGRLVLDNAALREIVGEAPRSAQVADYSADYAGFYPAGHPRAGEQVASDAWPLARTLATGRTVRDELVEVRRGDGGRRMVSISATPVRDAEARVVGGVATILDVTERERLLAAERAARAAADEQRTRATEANAAKAQFLATMSHELRTPLNAIGGYVQLLELGVHGPVTAEQQAALARVQQAQTRLLALINDVLNYAKLEAGRVEYDLRAVDAAEVVREVAPLVEPQARARGLRLDLRLPETHGQPTPCVVWADRDKLGQVLVNLLSNAVKFTAPPPSPGLGGGAAGAGGRVVVRLETAQDGGADVVFLHVEDTGVGIPLEKQAAIFEPFVQVRSGPGSPYAHATEGTGLGLAISRDLARGMGGDLHVRSAPGAGSTFTVTLRRADAAGQTP